MNLRGAYNRSFYTSDTGLASLQSAEVVVPIISSLVHPKSVVDVGCGSGAWLSVFRKHGVDRILGLDGEHVDPSWLCIPKECFQTIDLREPSRLDDQFDLAISLEVAEHLPKRSASKVVKFLVDLAPIVLFSAAIPCQEGNHHLNEQWPEYWEHLFQQHNYRMLDLVRSHIWKNQKIMYWYRQNIFLFVRADLMPTRPEFVEAAKLANDMVLVHSSVLWTLLSFRSTLKNLPKSAWKAALSRLKHQL